jgi:hypothetical protein
MESRSQLSQSVVNLQGLEANIDVNQVQKWLGDCTEGEGRHKECIKSKSKKEGLPRRFIDVGEPKQWPCIPKLLDTINIQGSDPEAMRYIALSHSWGTLSEVEQMLMSTTIKTLDDRRAGIDLLSLPTQYQAVIVLCRCLGIRYLWIDSLCIIQVKVYCEALSLSLTFIRVHKGTGRPSLSAWLKSTAGLFLPSLPIPLKTCLSL